MENKDAARWERKVIWRVERVKAFKENMGMEYRKGTAYYIFFWILPHFRHPQLHTHLAIIP